MPGRENKRPFNDPTIAITKRGKSINRASDFYAIGDSHGDAVRMLELVNIMYGLGVKEEALTQAKEEQDATKEAITNQCWAHPTRQRADYAWIRHLLEKPKDTWSADELALYDHIDGQDRLAAFEALFPESHHRTGKKVAFIGDLLADRKTNSLFMLKNFEQLSRLEQDFSIMYSNHDMIFLNVYKVIKERLEAYISKGNDPKDYAKIKAEVLNPMWAAIRPETGGDYGSKDYNQSFFHSFYSLVSFGLSMEKMVYEASIGNEDDLLKPLKAVKGMVEGPYFSHLKMAERVDLVAKNGATLPHYMTHAPQVLLNASESFGIIKEMGENLKNLKTHFNIPASVKLIRLMSEYLPHVVNKDNKDQVRQFNPALADEIPDNIEYEIGDLKWLLQVLQAVQGQGSQAEQAVQALQAYYQDDPSITAEQKQNSMFLINQTLAFVLARLSVLYEYINLCCENNSMVQPTSVFGLWSKIRMYEYSQLSSEDDKKAMSTQFKCFHQALMSTVYDNVYARMNDSTRVGTQDQLEKHFDFMINGINGFIMQNPEVLNDEAHELNKAINAFVWNRHEVIGLHADQVRISRIYGHQGTSRLDEQDQNIDQRGLNLDLYNSKLDPSVRAIVQGNRALSLPSSQCPSTPMQYNFGSMFTCVNSATHPTSSSSAAAPPSPITSTNLQAITEEDEEDAHNGRLTASALTEEEDAHNGRLTAAALRAV